ncbi:MAG: replication-associated recombination protein A [Acidobacteria bacterium]|jgi:putative ATPase|nr:replication-associated recombination protein A [Acidobacteriota bacterium]
MAALFGSGQGAAPLADRLRPRRWEDLLGLDAVAGPETPLGRQLREDSLVSTVLWGPPGCGKTTIARLAQLHTKRPFEGVSAVLSTVKEVREVMERARGAWRSGEPSTILFVDEIHRFNKAQQDAFLPYVEEGSVILLGTTTENPSFHLTSALLSRCRVVTLPPLDETRILEIMRRAVLNDEALLRKQREIPEAVLSELARMAAGDARFALNALEALCLQYPEEKALDPPSARAWLTSGRVVYDWGGEEHYNLISALHKSIRNSDPDAALYWLFRMLEGGEDPLFIARRVVRAASEDIGNADPRALRLALDAKEAADFLGMPEGDLALAQAVAYLAAAPKSNRIYEAASAVKSDLKAGHRYPVPLHLRNAPTRLMASSGYGDGYRYAHDEPEGVAAMECLPEKLRGRRYYYPKETGMEAKVKEWLHLWEERRARRGNHGGKNDKK